MALNRAICFFREKKMEPGTFKHDYKNSRKKYLIVFSLVLFFTVIAQGVIQYFIYAQKQNSKVINLAGRQRMLSQRISKLSLLHLDDKKSSNSTSLLSNLEIFVETHNDLKKGIYTKSVLANSELGIRQDYEHLDNFVNEIEKNVKCLVENCSVGSKVAASINNDSDQFLVQMDKIVLKLELLSEKELLNLSKIEFLLFLLLTIVFIVEFFIILLPFEKNMIHYFREEIRNTKERQRLYHLAEVGEISSGIIHEISNFLTLIKSSSQILRREIEQNNTKENVRHLDRIHKNVSRINNICLNMSKVSRVAQVSDFSVHELIDAVEEMFSETFKEKGIQYHVACMDDFKIYSNKTQILQVLFNLIKNSIYAVREIRNREIILEIYEVEDMISFKVTDSGKGIPKKLQDQVFESFFTTKEEGEGTGLGLSLSKRIANELLGDLQLVQSNLSTTFLFTIKAHL